MRELCRGGCVLSTRRWGKRVARASLPAAFLYQAKDGRQGCPPHSELGIPWGNRTMKTVALALLLLGPIGHAAVQSDIEYGTAAGVSLRLDASVPPGAGPFPIAILVHGGGWSSGDNRDMEVLGD